MRGNEGVADIYCMCNIISFKKFEISISVTVVIGKFIGNVKKRRSVCSLLAL